MRSAATRFAGKTEFAGRRYDIVTIVSEHDLREAVAKLGAVTSS